MTLLIVFYLIASLVLIGLSIPMIQRKIKPNPIYGFRTPRTLKDPVLWYAVNAYAGRGLLIVGLVNLVAAAILPLIPGISVDAYAMAFALVFAVTMIPAVVMSFVYLGKH